MKKRIAFALIMAIFTTAVVTFSVVVANLGFISGFIKIWLKSWLVAYIVAIPMVLLFGPQVQKLVDSHFKSEEK